MKNFIRIALLMLLLPAASRAQTSSAFPYATPIPNDSVTGTTQFTLTKINSSGNAIIMAPGDSNGYAGVCVANCGTSGTAWVAFAGLVPVIVDGTATIDHYVTISSGTGGDVHDTGATTYPGSGIVIGRVQTGATVGNKAIIDLFSPETQGSVSGPGSSTTGNVATYSNSSGSALADAGFLATNIVRKDAANTGAAAMTLDMSAATGATALKVPVIAGATAGADGVIDYDSTNKNTHVRTNNADSIVGAFASAPTTGDVVSATVSAGNTLLADAGFLATAVVTDANTKTLTNKTLDAEGTGNVVTLPLKVWLPAAGCSNATAGPLWDLPTSTPAVAACVTGTNIQKGVLQFADTTGGFSAQNTLILPADFTGSIDARIIWRTSATTGNAKWSLSTICTDVAATATDDPAFNTASTVTTAAPGTTLRIQTSSIASVTATGCVAGNLLHVKIFRDGNDAADTIAASADLLGVELTIRRAM